MEKRTTTGLAERYQRILVIRYRAIGDAGMVVWPVSGIRRLLPNTHIVWAAEPLVKPVIDTNQLVNDVVTIDRRKPGKGESRVTKFRALVRSHLLLRKLNIDLGFDFQGHAKTAIALRLSGARERLSVPAVDGLAARLNSCPPLDASSNHKVDQFYSLVRKALPIDAGPCIMPMCKPLDSQEKIVTITTGAGHSDKVVPIELLQDLANHLVDQGFSVVALGGTNDPKLQARGVQDLVGKTTLLDSMRLISGSALHIAGDTGTGHIAAAYQVPTLSIFTSHRNPPEVYQPYGPFNHLVDWAGADHGTPAGMLLERALPRATIL
ncbi:MAG: glycosyltransferase family 9 protein [Armatimonadetes bacterium]|nr:glycosyltransferase family 9 protein [Armatimonadota bacterium]